jgi:hypothetical protein
MVATRTKMRSTAKVAEHRQGSGALPTGTADRGPAGPREPAEVVHLAVAPRSPSHQGALEVAARRYADRTASRHPVHVATTLSADFMSEFEQPVGLGELIMVDTMVRVDVLRLASEVRERLASPVWRGRDAFSGRVGVPPP